MIYNAILRQFPATIFNVFKNNLYPTSIHVLQSAVSKIARSTKIPTGLKLYRGMSMALPDAFYQSDRNGCRGFAEWGFMSTTTDRAIAVQYCGVKDRKEEAKVLEINTSSANRGACISDYSQYPGEKEYLWSPLSFLESSGGIRKEATKLGVITVVDLLVSTNLKARTCKEIQEQKKMLYVASFKNLIDECTRRLVEIARSTKATSRFENDEAKAGRTIEPTWEGPGLIDFSLNALNGVLKRHEEQSAEDYLDDATYKSLEQVSYSASLSLCLERRFWYMLDTMHFRYSLSLSLYLSLSLSLSLSLALSLLSSNTHILTYSFFAIY
jgi:hypothetical protein